MAGGVAMGTASEFMITPYGSLIVGFCSGIVSTLGYLFLTVSFAVFYSTEIAHIEVKETPIIYIFFKCGWFEMFLFTV